MGDTECSQRILEGTYDYPPDTDIWTKKILQEAQHTFARMSGMEIATMISTAAFQHYWRRVSQQKKDLNEERKKMAALEQQLREMESALPTGIPPFLPHSVPLPLTSKSVRISDHFTQSDITLSQKFDSLLNLPPTHGDTPAEASGNSMDDVGRWD
jgi:hypothetical protein